MRPYRNTGGDSGVLAYDYGNDWILVQFRDGTVYEYTSSSAGQSNIDVMKRLADAGNGLNSFINTRVKKGYSRKIG